MADLNVGIRVGATMDGSVGGTVGQAVGQLDRIGGATEAAGAAHDAPRAGLCRSEPGARAPRRTAGRAVRDDGDRRRRAGADRRRDQGRDPLRVRHGGRAQGGGLRHAAAVRADGPGHPAALDAHPGRGERHRRYRRCSRPGRHRPPGAHPLRRGRSQGGGGLRHFRRRGGRAADRLAFHLQAEPGRGDAARRQLQPPLEQHGRHPRPQC